MTRTPAKTRRLGLALLALLCLGACMGDTRPHVVIEFGAYPEMFEGLEVEIDGKVVGSLKKTGALTRTGFPLDKGEHTIRVVSDRWPSQPFKLNAELKLQKTMLLLEIADGATADGRMTQMLVLRP